MRIVTSTKMLIHRNAVFHPGIVAALLSAILFGSSTPVAKLLLGSMSPWMLAGLLYLGSGIGLFLFRTIRQAPPCRLAPGEWPWLTGAILAGGVVAPVLLMWGLTHLPAAEVSLFLNAESVFTALLAWIVFRENVDRRVALGMLTILGGAAVLSITGEARFGISMPVLSVLIACFAWGLDNNLTRRVSLADASWIAAIKGISAGSVNLVLALLLGSRAPSLSNVLGALFVGSLAYGASLALFVVGLRHLGTARTGAYFSSAPLFGAILSIPLLGEAVSGRLLLAGLLISIGLWLHLSEKHTHTHMHEALEHEHEHVHDTHHIHMHTHSDSHTHCHTHWHRHDPLSHSHPHYPDAHHRHNH